MNSKEKEVVLVGVDINGICKVLIASDHEQKHSALVARRCQLLELINAGPKEH